MGNSELGLTNTFGVSFAHLCPQYLISILVSDGYKIKKIVWGTTDFLK